MNDGVLIRRDTVEWGNENYLTIVDSTNVWDVTDVTRADEEVTAGSFTYNDKNAVVVTGGDRGENIRTAWVWDKDEDTTPGHVAGVYDPKVESVVGNTITISKYAKDVLGTKELTEVLTEGLDDVDVRKVTPINGVLGDIMITDTDGDISFWNITYDNLRRITYNDRDYFRGQGDPLEVNSPVVLIADSTEPSGWKTSGNVSPVTGGYEWVSNAVVAQGAADVVMVDGWKVSNPNGVTTTGTVFATNTLGDGNNYLPAGATLYAVSGEGTPVTFMVKDSANKVIDSETVAAAGTATFTMPAQDVTLDWSYEAVAVTIQVPANSGTVDLGNLGTYRVSTDLMSGQTGDKVIVTVERTVSATATGTLTLTVTSGTATFDSYNSNTINFANNTGDTTWSFTMTLSGAVGNDTAVLTLTGV